MSDKDKDAARERLKYSGWPPPETAEPEPVKRKVKRPVEDTSGNTDGN